MAWGSVEWFTGYKFISHPGFPDDGAVDQKATFSGGLPYWGLGFQTNADPTAPGSTPDSLVTGKYHVGNAWGSPDGNPPYTWTGPTSEIMTYNEVNIFDGMFNGARPSPPPGGPSYTTNPIPNCIMLGNIKGLFGEAIETTCVLPYTGPEPDVMNYVFISPLKDHNHPDGIPYQNRYASSAAGGFPGMQIFVRSAKANWFPGYAGP